MAVNWDCGDCAAHHKAMEAAMVSGEFDYTVKEWDEFTDLREALIWALLVTKFPDKSSWKITEKNWKEVYVRLNILEKVRSCYRIYSVPDKNDPTKASRTEKRKVYFSPEEVHSMIGMAVNAGNTTDRKFQCTIYNMLREGADRSLEAYEKEQGDG